MDVGAWLRGLGLGRYERAFRDNDVDAWVLPGLTKEDLKEIGVASVGHRRLMLQAIAELPRSPTAVVPVVGAELDTATPGAESSRAERRQLTVMFADLVGSTALSARLDPEDMRDLLRGYQDSVAGIIARFGGVVAKFLGDGMLAYFGFPRAHEDDAERSVRAGLDIVDAVGRLRSPDGAPLGARVGIATGVVVVGDLIGSGPAQEQAVVGETPNLAARLQALAEPGAVVIAPLTRRLVGGLFECADLGDHAVKGFAEPARAWRVLGPGRAEGRFEALRGGSLAPVIGREQEVALLLERWERARGGEGQAVLLCGEPGIGKSCLVQALSEHLRDEPHAHLRYFCSPYFADSALHPVTEQLGRAASLVRDDSPERKLDKLEALFAQSTDHPAAVAPLVAALLSIPAGERYPPLSLSPQRRKEKTLAALVGQLEDLAARRPVLITWEDVHWSDPTSLELLDLVIDRAQFLRVLVVVTFRPEFALPWARHGHVTALTLARLGSRQAAALVDQLTGGKTLPAPSSTRSWPRRTGCRCSSRS